MSLPCESSNETTRIAKEFHFLTSGQTRRLASLKMSLLNGGSSWLPLIHVLALLKTVCDNRGVEVVLVHGNWLHQDTRHVDLAVVELAVNVPKRLLLGELHRGFRRFGSKRSERLVNGHALSTRGNTLASRQLRVLPR